MGAAELAAFWAGMTAGAFIALGFIGIVFCVVAFAVQTSARRWLGGL